MATEARLMDPGCEIQFKGEYLGKFCSSGQRIGATCLFPTRLWLKPRLAAPCQCPVALFEVVRKRVSGINLGTHAEALRAYQQTLMVWLLGMVGSEPIHKVSPGTLYAKWSRSKTARWEDRRTRRIVSCQGNNAYAAYLRKASVFVKQELIKPPKKMEWEQIATNGEFKLPHLIADPAGSGDLDRWVKALELRIKH
eukprot:338676-Amphidinium_carterae.1